MLNTVKNVLETIGTASAGLARTAASTTASATHTAADASLDAARALTAGAALVTSAGAKLLRKTPRKTLIGVAATVAAIGGAIYVVRYLKARGEKLQAANSESKKNVRTTQANKRVQKKSAAHAHHN